MPSVLIIDDEPEILETTRWAFELTGFDVATASTAEDALKFLESHHPQAFLIDYKLPGMSGADFLKIARANHPDIPAIMITGLTHQAEVIEAHCRELGSFAFLNKPLRMEEVLATVKKAVGAPHGS